MSRDDSRRYPRTIESKTSYLRIRAPEHLDVALEGLIRKVLKEQPKMDDIYAFAADYFDLLLRIREKSGIRKLSAQEICPYHNEEDAHEMIKLASTFSNRGRHPKSQPRTYKALTLRSGDPAKRRKYVDRGRGKDVSGRNARNEDAGRMGSVLPMVTEKPEDEEAKREDDREVAKVEKSAAADGDAEEFDDYPVRLPAQEASEVVIQAREVITEDAEEEEEEEEEAVPEQEGEAVIDDVGDIEELRDKIRVVESEIQQMGRREGEAESGDVVEGAATETAEDGDGKTAEADGSEDTTVGDTTTAQTGEVEEAEERKSDEAETKEAGEAEPDTPTDVKETGTTESNAEGSGEGQEMKSSAETAAQQEEVTVEEDNVVADTQGTEPKPEDPDDGAEDTNVESETQETEPKAEEAQEVSVASGADTTEGTEADKEKVEEEAKESAAEDVQETQGNEPEPEKTAEETQTAAVEVGAQEAQECEPEPEKTSEETEKTSAEDAAQETQETEPKLEEAQEVSIESGADKAEETETVAERAVDEAQETSAEVEETQETEPEPEVAAEEAQETSAEVQETQETEPEPELEVAAEEAQTSAAEDAVEEAQETSAEVEETQETEPEPEVAAEEAQETSAEVQETQETEPEPELEVAAEEAQTSAAEDAVEEAQETEAKTESASEEGIQTKEEDTTEEANVRSAVEEVQQLDPTEAKERELMAVEDPKDEKSESGAFLAEERRITEVESSEHADGTAEAPADQPEKEEAAIPDEKTCEDVGMAQTEETAPAPDEKETEVGNEVPGETDTGDGRHTTAMVGAGVVGTVAAALAGHELAKSKEDTPKEEDTEVVEETQPPPSAEEVLMGAGAGQPETTAAEEVQKFLDSERQHSSNDKESLTEGAADEPETQDSETGKEEESAPATTNDQIGGIAAQIVPETLARMSVDQAEPTEEKPTPGDEAAERTEPENVVAGTEPAREESDVEANDDQDREGSTTSDEIEFNTYPSADPGVTEDTDKGADEVAVPEAVEEVVPASEKEEEVGTAPGEGADTDGKGDAPNHVTEIPSTEAAETQGGDMAEPTIVLEINKAESEDQSDEKLEDTATEPTKAFLSVPGPVLEEYPGRKTGEDEEETETTSKDEDEAHELSRRKRSADIEEGAEEETEKTEAPEEVEVILDCGNVGNEIIQTGEVQRVELIEGEEDILQVHLTTTVQTETEDGDSIHVEMTSTIDPKFEVSVETRVESPVQIGNGENSEKMQLIRAAVIIQNGFRRFKNRKVSGEPQDEERAANLTVQDLTVGSETASESALSVQGLQGTSSRDSDSSFSSSATKINNKDFKERNLSRSATRTLLETHSLDPIRKISPLKTRSLSTVRYGVADFEVWNQLVQELEEAATKIQSNYRCYRTRKKLRRENAVQSTATPSEESTTAVDASSPGQRHTGEFHDSIVLPLHPK